MAKKSATAKKSRPTKGESLDEITQLLCEIEDAEEAVAQAELDYDGKREEMKTAKGVWHTRVSALREKVRSRRKWAEEAKRQPLLNGKKPEEAKPAEAAVPLPDGAKEAKQVKLLADIDHDCQTVAKSGETTTAYVDADGDLFFFHYATQADGTRAASPDKVCLEPEEWEEVKAASDAATTATATEWRSTRIDRCNLFTEKQAEALELAGIRTLGGLQELMRAHGQFWCKEMKINGRHKEDIEERFNQYLIKIQAE